MNPEDPRISQFKDFLRTTITAITKGYLLFSEIDVACPYPPLTPLICEKLKELDDIMNRQARVSELRQYCLISQSCFNFLTTTLQEQFWMISDKLHCVPLSLHNSLLMRIWENDVTQRRTMNRATSPFDHCIMDAMCSLKKATKCSKVIGISGLSLEFEKLVRLSRHYRISDEFDVFCIGKMILDKEYPPFRNPLITLEIMRELEMLELPCLSYTQELLANDLKMKIFQNRSLLELQSSIDVLNA